MSLAESLLSNGKAHRRHTVHQPSGRATNNINQNFGQQPAMLVSNDFDDEPLLKAERRSAYNLAVAGLVLASIALILGVLGTIALGQYNSGSLSKDEIWVQNLTVKGTLNFTDGASVEGEIPELTVGNLTVESVVATDLKSQTDMRIPITTNSSGMLPTTHDSHVLDNGMGMGMGDQIDTMLPIDESMVGRIIMICSTDGNTHTVSLPTGHSWDPNSPFPVLQFEEGKMPCCVTIKVITEDKFTVLKRDPCSVLCIDTNKTFCVDPERPAETNPWHGLWKDNTGGQRFLFFSGLGGAVEFDASVYPVRVRLPLPNSPAKFPLLNPFAVTFGLPEILLYAGNAGDPTILSTDDLPVEDLENGYLNEYSLRLQPDGTQFTAMQPGKGFTLLIDTGHRFLFTKTNEREFLESAQLVSSNTTDIYSRVFQFDYIVALIEQFSPASDYTFDPAGTTLSQATADALRNGPVSTTSNVHVIFNTQSVIDEITLIRTTSPLGVNAQSTVVFSGFTGPYAAMNDIPFRVFPVYPQDTRDLSAAFFDKSSDPNNQTLHDEFYIYYDSSSLPFNSTTGRAEYTGTPTVTVTHAQVVEGMEYLPFIETVVYYAKTVLGNRFHSDIIRVVSLVRNTGPFWPFFGRVFNLAETDAEINSGTPISFTGSVHTRNHMAVPAFYSGTNYQEMTIFSAFGVFIPSEVFPIVRHPRFPDIRVEPGIFNPAALYSYSLTRENYIVDAKVPYYRTSGQTKSSIINLMARTLYPGDQGDFFETEMFDFGVPPPYGERWSLFGSRVPNGQCNMTNTLPCYFGAAPWTPDPYTDLIPSFLFPLVTEGLYAGLVNPAYTSGRQIGYISMKRFSFRDFDGRANWRDMSSGPDTGDVFRDRAYALRNNVATMMRYLVTEKGVTDIILDTRGLFLFVESVPVSVPILREFFGSDETEVQSFEDYLIRDATGVRETKPQADFAFASTDILKTVVNPTLTEAEFPGSVFVGGNVVLISGGEYSQVQQFFNSDMGNGTTFHMVGMGAPNIEFTNFAQGALLVNGNKKFPAVPELRFEEPWFYNLEVHSDDVFDASGQKTRELFTTPVSPVPGYSGLAGGAALPADEESLLYPDLGFLPNTRPRLPGDGRPQQPIPNDPGQRGTWRDTWLEVAVEKIVNSKKRNTFDLEQRKEMQARGRRMAKRSTKRDSPKPSLRMKTCGPAQKTMVPLAESTSQKVLVYPNTFNATSADYEKFSAALTKAYVTAVRNGDVCLGSDRRVYVSKSASPLPKVKLAHETPYPLKSADDFPELKKLQQKVADARKQ